MKGFSEMDLYAPVCRFLEEQGFTVKSEVKHCDIVAQKGDRRLIVELKKAFQLKLVYQAIERQSLCEEVFVAIPRPEQPQNTKTFKSMIKLLKRLELGLLTVALDSPVKTVDVLLEPSDSMAWKNRKKQRQLMEEWEGRSGDYNVGGMTRRKIMTAYREKALELCCILEKQGTVSYKFLREQEMAENQIKMLSSNVYGWYVRVEKGVYGLSEMGRKVLQEENQEVVAYYRKKWKGEKV